MKAYEIGTLGIAEARWNDAGKSKLSSGEVIFTLDIWRGTPNILKELTLCCQKQLRKH